MSPIAGGRLRVTIETRTARPFCPRCEGRVSVKDRDLVELADLPCFGRPAVLVWRKVRWQCTARLWVVHRTGHRRSLLLG